ncbi:bifunctional diaminohydroxyphosphoribosylaminopyrimidine deaminase/5-amino-6-(5-phosphoribosylamino)uracil reductase RibD [Leptolyngbyaceae cyanobacterium CCMR0082]|uniref:Riboflavin biosynthesis protein RibD n=1 Tax=Adonisia turfae CCMR0082 TaxID=2304604 RepID=A0A6M0SBP6_9CYAN|nr:bifunctional diaminohydroxyphosphoribosylaminopyrimidine deaminase/5-amino-6-(5-phosphoribosylamino)uracil reductase RibD [Adonisia turfae]MDV3352726.1 bifunctional diaminohydroxyphosphoribosylaminopyrimidine deaminase/5-amino-6-(5-phosphoribosylamino)uracil reductase RibD [Leptothoe sp. LEGE 181152]NEZ65890.1 bifunctional diaminohydroxyphosphoribosylaminopyrimidine deaminase/5-amino-6-(5-phosphoribosylamino)uracil reductase RibD [Adonisia turfae CCMR0082]
MISQNDSSLPTGESHITMMHRCLELAAQGAGRTAPNPMVGAIVVKDGQIVGEGFHPQVGQPHAEVFALRAAGEAARGATIYVNLEPCNHTGRTPPCTEAVLQAGIATVVIGMRDPNPKASGGIERLRAAGVEVITDVETVACERLNEAFIHRIRHRQPFSILKYAMTLDGKIATDTGHSAWVTSPASRRHVHQLRGQCDAVIVGGNTVRKDNPRLTSHGVCDRNPLRVVMSRSLELPTNAHLWQTDIAPTLVFTEINQKQAESILPTSIDVVSLNPLTPEAVANNLFERGLSTILWECGGTLSAVALQQGVIQKVWAFIAPKLIGGSNAQTPIGDMGFREMTEALALNNIELQKIGPDWLIEGYLKD